MTNTISLEKVRNAIQTQEPIDGGCEGKIYAVGNGLVAKVRERVGAGYDQYRDNLGEHKRQAVHSAVNLLAQDGINWTTTEYGREIPHSANDRSPRRQNTKHQILESKKNKNCPSSFP